MSFNVNPEITCGMDCSQYRYSTAKESGDAGRERGIQLADIF
jgi:hypothetical protein